MRKSLVLLVALVVVVVSGWSSGASAVPITNGLVAAYEFSGNANDVSGNGNDGVVNGATLTTDRFGNANSAYSFDGVDDFIGVPTTSNIELENSNLSIGMWVRLPGSNTQQYDLIDKLFPPGTYDHYVSGFVIHTGTGLHGTEAGVTRFCVANNSIGGIACFDSTTNIVDGQYHHLAVTRTSGNDVAIYIDGVNDGAVLDHITTGPPVTPPESMSLGASHTNQDFVNGLMDDIYIYNRALSPAEVSALYTAPIPEPNTALLLSLGLTGLSWKRRRSLRS